MVDDGVEYFEVDHIVKQGLRGRGSARLMCYLIRWKGYGPLEDSWEDATQIQRTAPEAVRIFREKSLRRL